MISCLVFDTLFFETDGQFRLSLHICRGIFGTQLVIDFLYRQMCACLSHWEGCWSVSSWSLGPIDTDIQGAHLLDTSSHGHLWFLVLPTELALLAVVNPITHVLDSWKIIFPLIHISHIAGVFLHFILFRWVLLRRLLRRFQTFYICIVYLCILRSKFLLRISRCFIDLLLEFGLILAGSFILFRLV